MITEIRIPKLGMTMQEATLQQWLFPDGAEVDAGAILYTIETDKTVTEIEAPASGVLRILAAPEADYPVGALIGSIE